MLIHHIHESTHVRWVTDPQLGLVQRHEPVIKASDVHQITHDGVEYDIGEDLTFDVPDEVGQALISRPALGWRAGPNPFYVEDPDVELEQPIGEPVQAVKRTRSRKQS